MSKRKGTHPKNIDNELILMPWLQDCNRNLSPMVPDYPDGNRYQEAIRQPRPSKRHGLPEEPPKTSIRQMLRKALIFLCSVVVVTIWTYFCWITTISILG